MGVRKELAYTYAFFTEAGMVATHGAPYHSTTELTSWNFCKASQLLQTTQSPRTVTASTINK